MSAPNAPTLALSLISHTNVGKTTLARTLLRRDVGVVADEAHVTDISESFELFPRAADGSRLLLWDTPGFGDSARLAKRLQLARLPIVWFLSRTYDRLRDRALWCSQQAIRNIKNDADLVLYLVNATETPESAGYAAPELQILEWLEKPVIALVNQTSDPADPVIGRGLEAWKSFFSSYPFVARVLALDAFSRNWLHEDLLFDAITAVVPPSKTAMACDLAMRWKRRNRDLFEHSMDLIAEHIIQSAHEQIELREGDRSKRQDALKRLAAQLEKSTRDLLNELIACHGIAGEDREKLLGVIGKRTEYAIPTGRATLLGAILAGAANGLAADVTAGGLTFGGGAVVGAVLGAFGFYGASEVINFYLDRNRRIIAWRDEDLVALLKHDLLSYLHVAHFGRGRGEWRRGNTPQRWEEFVSAIVGEIDMLAKQSPTASWRHWSGKTRAALVGVLGSRMLAILEEMTRIGSRSSEIQNAKSTDLL